MDDSSIAVRTEKLRREIQLIQQEEHRCPCQRGHSLADNEEHAHEPSARRSLIAFNSVVEFCTRRANVNLFRASLDFRNSYARRATSSQLFRDVLQPNFAGRS